MGSIGIRHRGESGRVRRRRRKRGNLKKVEEVGSSMAGERINMVDVEEGGA